MSLVTPVHYFRKWLLNTSESGGGGRGTGLMLIKMKYEVYMAECNWGSKLILRFVKVELLDF